MQYQSFKILNVNSCLQPILQVISSDYPWCEEHDDVIKWKHFPHYWRLVRGIHRSLANSPHKGQSYGALMFPLFCALNKRLSRQSWGWWFETPSRSLWRHYNEVRLNHIWSKVWEPCKHGKWHDFTKPYTKIHWIIIDTVWCRYNAVNFLQIFHKRYPITI